MDKYIKDMEVCISSEITAYTSYDDGTFIKEGVDVVSGVKVYRFDIPLTTAGTRSVNGLVFTRDELEWATQENPEFVQRMSKGGILGNLNHPTFEATNYHEVDIRHAAIRIIRTYFKDNTLWGTCESLPTKNGETLAGLITIGYTPAVSMRGRFMKDQNSPTGRRVMITAYDVVGSPSNKASYANMDSVKTIAYGKLGESVGETVCKCIKESNSVRNKINESMKGVSSILNNNFAVYGTDCKLVKDRSTLSQAIQESASSLDNIDGVIKNSNGVTIGYSSVRETADKIFGDDISNALARMKREYGV